MKELPLCPTCRAPIPADAPEGVCPACALGRGFASAAVANPAKEESAFRASQMAELAAVFPDFELLELIGRGGMGEVYKARQKRLDRLVAIKILPEPFGKSDEFTERFLREAQSLAQLNHPNIVTIHDHGESNGVCYFVMEFIDGVDLRRALAARSLQQEDALRIVPQICDALQYAHDAGIVHRDIKPANILLDRAGRVKIADFGLAKLIANDPEKLTLTSPGAVLGTPDYMAPEQRRASQAVDHRADIYSLGVVFYEMLTGEVPMGRFTPPSTTPGVDARLDEVVMRTLEREPERRYQRASDVKSGVETVSGAARARTESADAARGADLAVTAGFQRPSRFSRAALLGAVTAPFAFIAAPMVAGSFFAQSWWMLFAGVALGLFSLVGTTLLGGWAIARIRRAGGKMHGMPLAVIDLLFFPLLILNVAVLGHAGDVPFLVLLPIALALDFFIARAVWQAANRVAENPSAGRATSSPSSR